MKKLAITILVLVVVYSCRKDKTNLSYKECHSKITAVTESYFKQDAIAFGIERLTSDSLSDYLFNPVYRHEESTYALGKLSAIFHEASKPNSPLYEPVFKYQIHKERGYSTTRLAFRFDSTEIQENFLYHPEDETNPVLREMLDKMGYVVEGPFYLGQEEWVVMKSSEEYVQQLFVKRLIESPGIDAAFVGYFYINYDHDIFYSWTDDYDEFIFEYGMGDCPLGCTEFHYWKVRVDKDCNVTLVSEYGDPLPG